jgi:hypothetical protein
MLHKSIAVSADGARVTVNLDIDADEDDPRARLSAIDEAGAEIGSASVAPSFKLTRATAAAWVESGFRKPG